ISAAGLYGQLTTGNPIRITSKVGPGKPAHYCEIHIDTTKNMPVPTKEEDIEWGVERGTRVEIELEAKYQKGHHSVDEYLREVALANPHVAIIYHAPDGQDAIFERSTTVLPPEPKTIRPHPYGVELGVLGKMLKDTKCKRISQFLCNEFSRVSPRVAAEICDKAGITPTSRPHSIAHADAERLFRAINATKIMNPPTNCIWPIGKDLILAGMKKVLEAEHYVATTRPPSVYRGNPFLVEAGIAYGGKLPTEGPVQLLRFANRVPLLYQQSACSITESVIDTSWKNYGLDQPRGSLPAGGAAIFVHLASVWVPFTSESKEAIADYPEITKEVKLALQECGRNLLSFVRKREHEAYEAKRRSIFELYAGELVESLHHLTGSSKERLSQKLMVIAKKRTGLVTEQPPSVGAGGQ
ncbi:MAG: DNA topoisomerase VI subunit B, partial [Planctomycetota bacterium]|nr:DNA topoisomerase VI subunit B [Planctomycetota bacterium]